MNEIKNLFEKYKQFITGVLFTLLVIFAFSLMKGHNRHGSGHDRHEKHGACCKKQCDTTQTKCLKDSLKTK